MFSRYRIAVVGSSDLSAVRTDGLGQGGDQCEWWEPAEDHGLSMAAAFIGFSYIGNLYREVLHIQLLLLVSNFYEKM